MKFSVVTTCLNAKKYIRETIDSVLSQTGDFEVEYIITDAGSTDGTLEIIKSYGDKIKLIDASGTSQSVGFNVGIENATGDLVSFINADDIYIPNAFQKVYDSFIKNENTNWFVGKCRIVNEKGIEIDKWISNYKNFWIKHYSYLWLLVENFIPHPSTFIKREIFSKYEMYKDGLKYTMDYDLWLRIGKENKPAFVDFEVATFRREPNTKSNSGFIKQMKEDRNLGINYSIKHKYFFTIPFKFISWIRTITIYKFIYG